MKKNIAVLAGGYSGEYEISIKSARMLMQTLNKEKYNTYLVCITPLKWVYIDENSNETPVDKNDFSIVSENNKIHFDCVFNIIHGTPGEDGKIQGYLDMLGIPYTSCNQYVSALTFNKAYCNYVVESLGVSVPRSAHLIKNSTYDIGKIIDDIKLPAFVKPCNGGSSFGTTKVKSAEDMEKALELAFSVDDELLIEEFINGTEITCGLFKYKNRVTVFPLTEIVSNTEFFDFEAKYEGKSEEITPARISPAAATMCSATSTFLYNKLNCKGVVRIDYILTRGGKMFFLEVNTIPGMSEQSIVPQQAQVFGYSLPDFLDMLIEEALTK
ncbi:MAG TPA: D-alanine--D-alanine ligase [Bacteroidales bacterium]|nr:D-alanine--D-alanine ligase [Bacteroidales bacterium]HNZ43718.1 D-alanine--D-alanine ligase [Bacteroidales bacterium]HOH83238.1 D-alanine--D-alanine ligase [Bacteroidales bacterium]HPB24976.1 D-alanine--D-alanine ligase [Bacteroidales bacterium]HPI30987.1 D-alanine--D-alanine ligase [Bacteroidales bacterium]